MSKFIDANAYIEYCDEHWIPLNVDAVKAQPTADVVEVVYCEDCKHKEYCSQNIAMFGKGRDMYEAIHYCSYGERREDGE